MSINTRHKFLAWITVMVLITGVVLVASDAYPLKLEGFGFSEEGLSISLSQDLFTNIKSPFYGIDFGAIWEGAGSGTGSNEALTCANSLNSEPVCGGTCPAGEVCYGVDFSEDNIIDQCECVPEEYFEDNKEETDAGEGESTDGSQTGTRGESEQDYSLITCKDACGVNYYGSYRCVPEELTTDPQVPIFVVGQTSDCWPPFQCECWNTGAERWSSEVDYRCDETDAGTNVFVGGICTSSVSGDQSMDRTRYDECILGGIDGEPAIWETLCFTDWYDGGWNIKSCHRWAVNCPDGFYCTEGWDASGERLVGVCMQN